MAASFLRLFGAVLCSVVVAAQASTAAALTRKPVLVDTVGRWTLKRLGYRDLVFRPTGPSSQHVYFSLPPGAHQGGKTWYLFHLHFRISFTSRGSPREALVKVENNTSPFAEIGFLLNPQSANRKLEWETIGLIGGQVDRVSRHLSATIRFSDFLGSTGLRGGLSDLRFSVRVDKPGGVRLKRLVVFADSALEISPLGPSQLTLGAGASTPRPREGESFEIRYLLRNPGQRRVKNISVGLGYDRHALELEGPATQSFSGLAPGARRAAAFRLRALRAGHQQITLDAISSGDRPGAVVDLRIAPAPRASRRGSSHWQAWLLGAGGLAIVAGLALLRTWRPPKRK